MQDITQSELILNLILSAALFGIIWLIQVVHYPSFHKISEENWQAFYMHHAVTISWITMPLMLAEFIQTGMLVLRSGISGDWIIPLMIIVLIWISTVFYVGPLQNKLAEHKNEQVIDQLIRGNWIRTLLWSLKLIYVSWVCYISLS